MSTDAEYMVDEIVTKLVGFRIVQATVSEDGESFGFVVERDPHGKPIERKTVWVDCDAEGNGPGWLKVEDRWMVRDMSLSERLDAIASIIRKLNTFSSGHEPDSEALWDALNEIETLSEGE